MNNKFRHPLPLLNGTPVSLRDSCGKDGFQICGKHTFCSRQHEFNDQSIILKTLSQPFSSYNGIQLPLPRELPETGQTSISRVSRNGSLDFRQTLFQSHPQGPVSRQDLTEESLDDWIAQSQNRPIISFLDPYKKFNVPERLMSCFKQRYKRWLRTKERDFEKKLLYFQDKLDSKAVPHYQLPTRRPREAEKSITFRSKELRPRSISGTPIGVREKDEWRYLVERLNKQNQLSSFYGHQEGEETIKVVQDIQVGIHDQISQGVGKEAERSLVQRRRNFRSISLSSGDVIQTGGQLKGIQRIQLPQNAQISALKTDSRQDDKIEKQEKVMEKDNLLIQMVQQLLQEEEKPNGVYQKQTITLTEKQPILQGRKGYNQHIKCNLEVEKISKSEMSDATFAFWKAVRRIQKQAHIQAIACLKETLYLDNLHFKSIFNLGCLYERLGCYETGRKWFEVALKFSPTDSLSDVRFGISICEFHLGNFQNSFDHISAIFSSLSEKRKDHLYLRAICSKEMKNYEQAVLDYHHFLLDTNPPNFQLLIQLVFASVIKGKRHLELRVSPTVLSNFTQLLSTIIISKTFEPALSQLLGDDSQWIDSNFALKRLKILSFFRRFDEVDLKKCLLSMRLSVISPKQVIFPKDGEVIVLSAGTVAVQDHSKQLDKPEVVSYFTEGDIIGYQDKEHNYKLWQDKWFVSLTEVEILVFSAQQFNELWQTQLFNSAKCEILRVLSSLPLFSGVSETILYLLAFELFEVQTFRKGEIIFNDGQSVEAVNKIELKKQDQKAYSRVEKMTSKTMKIEYSKKKISGMYIVKSGSCELDSPTDCVS